MRYPDWPIRLNEYIIAAQKKEFQYGTHDCTTFIIGAIEAIQQGSDIRERYAPFAGQYDSKATSSEALKQVGAGTLYKTLRRELGKPVPGCRGKKGDIAFFNGHCGIILGRLGLFLGPAGYSWVRLSAISKAFPID